MHPVTISTIAGSYSDTRVKLINFTPTVQSWENWGIEMLNNLPTLTQKVSSKGWDRTSSPQCSSINHTPLPVLEDRSPDLTQGPHSLKRIFKPHIWKLKFMLICIYEKNVADLEELVIEQTSLINHLAGSGAGLSPTEQILAFANIPLK